VAIRNVEVSGEVQNRRFRRQSWFLSFSIESCPKTLICHKWRAFQLSANNPKRASLIRGFKQQVTRKTGARAIAREK
jgi:hypothetical protein